MVLSGDGLDLFIQLNFEHYDEKGLQKIQHHLWHLMTS